MGDDTGFEVPFFGQSLGGFGSEVEVVAVFFVGGSDGTSEGDNASSGDGVFEGEGATITVFETVELSVFVGAEPDVSGADAEGFLGATVVGVEAAGRVDDADAVEAVVIELWDSGDHEDVAGAFAFDDLEVLPGKDVAWAEIGDFGDLFPRTDLEFFLTSGEEGFAVVGGERASALGTGGAIDVEVGFGEMASKNMTDEAGAIAVPNTGFFVDLGFVLIGRGSHVGEKGLDDLSELRGGRLWGLLCDHSR